MLGEPSSKPGLRAASAGRSVGGTQNVQGAGDTARDLVAALQGSWVYGGAFALFHRWRVSTLRPTCPKLPVVTSVLFLDIDGVLNSERYRYGHELGVLANDFIDPDAVKTLNHITRRWELKVVVSSAWRVLPELDAILRAKGVQAEIIGKTPVRAAPRGEEIALWLADHAEVTAYVILDDDGDMGELRDHLVQTDYRYGLRPEDIERVAAVLQPNGSATAPEVPTATAER